MIGDPVAPACLVTSVSCASPGNCSAAGYYFDGASQQQAFAASLVGDTWGNAVEVPGTAAINAGSAAIASISCTSAGSCSAGGYYTDSAGSVQAFVVAETNAGH